MIVRFQGPFALLALCLALVTLLLPGTAQAVQRFAVAQFRINGPDQYQYLNKGIQDMLLSRLHWAGNFEALGKDKVDAATGNKPLGDTEAGAVMERLGADYLVYGSVTILGQEASVDIRVQSAKGQAFPQTSQTQLDRLIPTLELLAGKINGEIFKRPDQATASKSEPQRVNAMNPDLVHNETTAGQEVYLNPQFRYAGDAESSGRIRSRSLPFAANSMVVGDATGDGRMECIIASDNSVHAFRFDANSEMTPLGEFQMGHMLQILRLSMIDLNRDGVAEIIASAVYQPQEMDVQRVTAPSTINSPRAYIFNLKNDKLELVEDDVKLFLATAAMPPDYMPKLVGQVKGSSGILETPVHEVVKMGGEYTLGPRIMLPPEGTVYNFTFLPQEGTDYKILITDKKDMLRVYTRTGDRQWTSDKPFSGSAMGLVDPVNQFGMRDRLVMHNPYYIPMRMVPIDLDRNGVFEVLLNHPVSVAAQFFSRYRYYPQGEIHCLAWDGVGMSLVWKTRRIKGSVADYGVGDINNDGIQDLYVLVNTHPGVVGVKQRRSAVLIYPLDTTTPAGVPIDREFTEEQ